MRESKGNPEAWPRICIITPNLNYGHLLEGTIRSVLLQGYPNLQYIVIDGGSSDYSVDVIRKYERWLSHWESRQDKGQSNAINKGLVLCDGNIVNWVNSDDLLAPRCLENVAMAWKSHRANMIAGRGVSIDSENRHIGYWYPEFPQRPIDILSWSGVSLLQPACFLDLSAVRRCGGVREDLHFAMDRDLWVRMLEEGSETQGVGIISEVLAFATIHNVAKTSSDADGLELECLRLRRERLDGDFARWQWRLFWLDLKIRRITNRQIVCVVRREHPADIFELMLLGARRPTLFLSRFYLGAVRQEILAGLKAKFARFSRNWQEMKQRIGSSWK